MTNADLLHVFRAKDQSATRYRCGAGFTIKNKPTSLFWCYGCGRRRQAKNLRVQSYYDGDRFFCKGGCK